MASSGELLRRVGAISPAGFRPGRSRRRVYEADDVGYGHRRWYMETLSKVSINSALALHVSRSRRVCDDSWPTPARVGRVSNTVHQYTHVIDMPRSIESALFLRRLRWYSPIAAGHHCKGIFTSDANDDEKDVHLRWTQELNCERL